MKFFSALALVPYLSLQVASGSIGSSPLESDEAMETKFQKANHHSTPKHALSRRDYYEASPYEHSHKRKPRFLGGLLGFMGPFIVDEIIKLIGVTKEVDMKGPDALKGATKVLDSIIRSGEKALDKFDKSSDHHDDYDSEVDQAGYGKHMSNYDSHHEDRSHRLAHESVFGEYSIEPSFNRGNSDDDDYYRSID